MPNINKNIIMQAGAAVANATNKAAGLSASTPEPGSIISAIQLVNGGRTIGPDALAHFTESVRNKLLSLLVGIESIQSGSGTPSPDNVRPISGRTGLTIYVSPTPNAADATTYAVDWSTQAGTVYSGTVDVVTGVLTVDKASVLFDGTQTVGTANWRPNSSSVGWLYAPSITPGLLNVTIDRSNLQSCGLLSDTLETVVYGGSTGIYGKTSPCISLVGGTNYGVAMRLNDTTLTTAAKINEYLSANPIRVVYKLATPLTYQFTGTDIVTLVGDNYIWSDSGDVTITE